MTFNKYKIIFCQRIIIVFHFDFSKGGLKNWINFNNFKACINHIYMAQIRDDSTFTSNGVIKKLKYIDQHFVAFEARDLILSFSKNSAIMIFRKI